MHFQSKKIHQKKIKIWSLKSELVNIKSELDSKVSELERLKSKNILVLVVGGDSEKNISKSNNISAVSEPSKNLSQYFAHKKIMNKVEKISTDIPTHTNNKIVPILESSKIDTEVISKISDETIINKNSEDRPKGSLLHNNKDNILQPIDTGNQFQEIKNMTLIKSHNITIERSEELPIIVLDASIVNDKYQTTSIKVMDSQSVMQKNSKTELPLIKLFFIDIDEATKYELS
ncbi:hypothetical protein F8M41_016527 [Gigaspora margarita]|uniref:Uncharacterized protein n=1 Tax=Gigaspora margarita TaxID=4874 RepID=A0A8H3ZYS6_GIGMA|nr:hypothetical protein F8M41_016527 [Gigaspora margarita]